jgi:hypothetical protein
MICVKGTHIAVVVDRSAEGLALEEISGALLFQELW